MVRTLILILVAASASCMETRYAVQAGMGQLELWARSRDVDQVLEDPEVDERTKALLRESRQVLEFARRRGLSSSGNYGEFVELDRSAVVWFLAAAEPLSLEPLVWTFPIAGSFPYLGWFSQREALQMRERLGRDGYDVYMRPVRAFSTGGYFDDPVLSTMLSDDEDAYRYLANVLFHELTHANYFVPDQAVYNESLASFVGDQMAEDYLLQRFGEGSDQVQLFRQEMALYSDYGAAFVATYAELEKLYASDKSDTQKLARKRQILEDLEIRLDLPYRPNNASLAGFKTYNTGLPQFRALFAACGGNWRRFLAIVGAIDEDAFAEDQSETFGELLLQRRARCQGS